MSLQHVAQTFIRQSASFNSCSACATATTFVHFSLSLSLSLCALCGRVSNSLAKSTKLRTWPCALDLTRGQWPYRHTAIEFWPEMPLVDLMGCAEGLWNCPWHGHIDCSINVPRTVLPFLLFLPTNLNRVSPWLATGLLNDLLDGNLLTEGNQLESIPLWWLPIPKMYMGTIWFDILTKTINVV